MKLKNTFILLGLVIAIFCFIQFYESKYTHPTSWNEYAEGRITIFNPDTVEGVIITNNEDKIELRKQEGVGWLVVSPVKDRADLSLVHQLLSDLAESDVKESFQIDEKGAEKTSLKELGLETSNIRVKLIGKDAPAEFLFGKDAPSEGKTYVRLDGSKRICVVSSTLKAQIQKKTDDFRDRRLIQFNPGIVNRMDVKSAAGEIEVLKDRGEWSVNKPLKARGDAQKITDLVAQTINTHIDTFLPENGANLATYGLAEPRGSITLNTEGSDQPAILQIGQPTEQDKEKVYAKLSTRESIYVLPKKIEEVLNIKPNDVRDKSLLKLNLDIVDRVHIEFASKPKLTFVRSGEEWVMKTSGDAAANAIMVRNLAAYLQAVKVTGFVADIATDLPKYSLDKPQLKITFSSYASENTSESKAGENTILTLSFGKIDGNIIYARLENEPYIVSVSKAIFEAIPSDPAVWQDTAIYKYKPEEITSLEILRDGQAVALERNGKGSWKLKNSAGAPNQFNVQSLVNTLANLHSVRWLGSTTNGLGFDRPTLQISFTTAGKKTGRLTIGNSNSEAMWNAQAEGHMGAFLVSKPDYEALHADLIDAATPTPSQAESPSGAGAGVK